MQKKTDTIRQTTQRRQLHQAATKITQITPMQRELLDMFAQQELSEKELSELKDLLSDYFFNKAQNALEVLAAEKNWNLTQQADQWGKEKLRTPYRHDRSS